MTVESKSIHSSKNPADEIRSTCRSCGSAQLSPVLSFGAMPLADALATKDEVFLGEPRHFLTAVFCRECFLMQIKETVPPEVLFCQNYPYYSSFSDELLAHSRDNAFHLIKSRKLDSSSLVVELASNDGYLLKNFQERGIPVLGIDPADGPAEAAARIGVPTLCEFFGLDMAQRLVSDGVRADVVIGNNVLAHVADLNGFVSGIALLLKDDGVAVIESPYVRDLIENCEFDTIYHEHLCYYSVSALATLFKRHGLILSDLQHLSIHGGSLRLYVTRNEPMSEAVKLYLQDERELGLTSISYYEGFGDRATRIRSRLRSLLQTLKASGQRIAAYGAAAKGATMVNYCGIDSNLIDFVVDRNVHKQGLFLPGVSIPIVGPEELLKRAPDYTLILAWNFKEEIIRQQAEYTRRGGKWIVPIPQPQIV